MVVAGRIGKLKKAVVMMGKNVTGGPFTEQPVPKHFNWNLWQGQTPDVPYLSERTHYTFRWWYEYSGGEMTDTGAHHLDIAQWAIGKQISGPVFIEGSATYPTVTNGFNVATQYQVRYRYDNEVELLVIDRPGGIYNRDGIMFEGEDGHIFVNRSGLYGTAVQELANRPLPRGDFGLYGHDNVSRPERMGKIDAIKNHMGNFYDCTLSRQSPMSDVACQHRSATLCHLGNIAQRIGRPLEWNPVSEQFTGADDAAKLLAREQRKGFEVA
jgi:predicted dehydrogenase